MKGRTNAGGGAGGKESVWMKVLRQRTYGIRAISKDGLPTITADDIDELYGDIEQMGSNHKYSISSHCFMGMQIESVVIPDSTFLAQNCFQAASGRYHIRYGATSGAAVNYPLNIKFQGSASMSDYIFYKAYLSGWPKGLEITTMSSYIFGEIKVMGSTIFEVPEGVTNLDDSVCISIDGFYCIDDDDDNFGKAVEGTLVLPSTVTSMKGSSLMCSYNTKGTNILRMKATTPPTLGSYSLKSYPPKEIIVPAGCLEAYQSATNWSALADIMVEATE